TAVPNTTPAAIASFRRIRCVTMGAPRSQRAGGVGPLRGDPLATLDLDREDALRRRCRLVLDETQRRCETAQGVVLDAPQAVEDLIPCHRAIAEGLPHPLEQLARGPPLRSRRVQHLAR